MKLAVSMCLCVLVCVGVVRGQETSAPVSEERSFTTVERIGDPGYRSFFMFSTNGRGYTIRADGYAESGTGKGRSTNFTLPMGRSGHLVRVYFFEYENDLLLMYELSDQRLGWGYLVRLNEKTLKTKWAIPINGYNIGPALVEAANEVYLSAANFLARLDLTTGRYVWQQEDPQKQYPLAFNGFRLPVLDGARVLFTEERPQGKTVELERVTGKIVALRD
jgi:outer membrane protein assembly factor BamB